MLVPSMLRRHNDVVWVPQFVHETSPLSPSGVDDAAAPVDALDFCERTEPGEVLVDPSCGGGVVVRTSDARVRPDVDERRLGKLEGVVVVPVVVAAVDPDPEARRRRGASELSEPLLLAPGSSLSPVLFKT